MGGKGSEVGGAATESIAGVAWQTRAPCSAGASSVLGGSRPAQQRPGHPIKWKGRRRHPPVSWLSDQGCSRPRISVRRAPCRRQESGSRARTARGGTRAGAGEPAPPAQLGRGGSGAGAAGAEEAPGRVWAGRAGNHRSGSQGCGAGAPASPLCEPNPGSLCQASAPPPRSFEKRPGTGRVWQPQSPCTQLAGAQSPRGMLAEPGARDFTLAAHQSNGRVQTRAARPRDVVKERAISELALLHPDFWHV